MSMFNIGMPELVVILAVALIVLGPNRLPEVARMLGKALAEFRKATSGFTQELDSARAMLEEEARRAAEPPPHAAATGGVDPKSTPGTAPRTNPAPSPDGPSTATS
jgi:sec-independent protein translocase protein TatA